MATQAQRKKRRAYNAAREVRDLLQQFANLAFWVETDDETQDNLVAKAVRYLNGLRIIQRQRAKAYKKGEAS